MSESMSSSIEGHAKYYLVTGVSLILMAALAGFVLGFVHGNIYVPEDAESTTRLLQENLVAYKYGVLSWAIIIVLDLIVSMGIYKIYCGVQQKLAALTSSLRIIYTLFLSSAVAQLAMPLINEHEKINSSFHFESFDKIWSYGLVVFGAHLLMLSALCFKSKIAPQLISILLLLGGISYIFIEGSESFFTHLDLITPIIESVLMIPMAFGEFAFAVWLIIKFVHMKKFETI